MILASDLSLNYGEKENINMFSGIVRAFARLFGNG